MSMKSAKEKKNSGLLYLSHSFLNMHLLLFSDTSMDAKQDPKLEIWEFQLAESFNRHNTTCFADILMVLVFRIEELLKEIHGFKIYIFGTLMFRVKSFFFLTYRDVLSLLQLIWMMVGIGVQDRDAINHQKIKQRSVTTPHCKYNHVVSGSFTWPQLSILKQSG